VKLPIDNLALKAASVALASLLWYVIAGEKTSEMGLTVPVELQNFPHDLELTGEPVNAVEVRLRASPGIIQRIGPGDVTARVDLAGVGEGEHIVHLTGEAIRVPFGVTVVRVNPSTISLNFERTLQKTVPVRPRLTGRPAPGFEVAEVGAQPAEVRLSGPKSRVQEVESAFTEPVSVEGAGAAVSDHVNIGLEDPLLRVLGSSRVQVTAHVREATETRTFPALDLSLRGGTAAVAPAKVDVTLAGPASVLRQVDRSQVRPYADLAQASGGTRAPVGVDLQGAPAGVTVKEWTPDHVTLRAARRPRR
jgi:YbbR domain-containing protein